MEQKKRDWLSKNNTNKKYSVKLYQYCVQDVNVEDPNNEDTEETNSLELLVVNDNQLETTPVTTIKVQLTHTIDKSRNSSQVAITLFPIARTLNESQREILTRKSKHIQNLEKFFSTEDLSTESSELLRELSRRLVVREAKIENVIPIYIAPPMIEVYLLSGVLFASFFTFICCWLENSPIDPALFTQIIIYIISAILAIDVWVQLYLTCKNEELNMWRYIFNTLIHHLATLGFLLSPLFLDNLHCYMLTHIGLSVEYNALLLKIRRIVDRESAFYNLINQLFYLTWFFFRGIVFPGLCIYLCYLWIVKGCHFDLYLNGVINCTMLLMLYSLWTYNLLRKSLPNNANNVQSGEHTTMSSALSENIKHVDIVSLSN